MHDEDEEIEESIFKMDGDDDLDTVEGMNDFGLDEEDPDRDRKKQKIRHMADFLLLYFYKSVFADFIDPRRCLYLEIDDSFFPFFG